MTGRLAIGAIVLLMLLAACAPPQVTKEVVAQESLDIPEGAIVLRVKVVAVVFTDVESCCGRRLFGTPFGFWYRYKANVVSVLGGSYPGLSVTFGHVQHAEYISRVTEDCYVVLVPADGETRQLVGVDMIAVGLYSEKLPAHQDAFRKLRDGI